MKKSVRLRLLALVFVVFALTIGGYVAFAILREGSNTSANDSQVTRSPVPTVIELWEATNKEREKAGVKPLALDPRLNMSAQGKADDMRKNDYFSHTNPVTGKQGYDWINETGIKCTSVAGGENIQQGGVTDAPSIIGYPGGFMSSESHREAMLHQAVDVVGFGVAGDMVVQHLCDLAE